MKRVLLILVLGVLLLGACGSPTVAPPTSPPTAPQTTPAPTPTPTPTPTTPTPPPPAPASFATNGLNVSPAEVNVGDTITISVQVRNTGGIEGSYTVVLNVNKVGGWTTFANVFENVNEEVTLKAGETKTVTFTTTKSESGTYTVDVNGKVGQFTVTAPPAPTWEEIQPAIRAEQVIKDLAYITALAWPYSDDADPEDEGVKIFVSYYDSKSGRIYFTGVPVTVTVELYWYTNFPLIYQKQVIMDSSGDLFGEVLRIPFVDVQGRPNGMPRYLGPILVVVVTTPTQGAFEYRGKERMYWPD